MNNDALELIKISSEATNNDALESVKDFRFPPSEMVLQSLLRHPLAMVFQSLLRYHNYVSAMVLQSFLSFHPAFMVLALSPWRL